MAKWLSLSMLVILALLNYSFWFGSGSILKVRALRKNIRQEQQELAELTARNQNLIGKIDDLRKHPLTIEEQARYELGMIKQNEQYYQVVEPIE